MNKILSKMIFGAALLMLAACTNDEPVESNTLPEGKYPLEIASVTMNVESSSEPWGVNAPQTRVAESADNGMSSVWTDGDRIGVRIGNDTETGIYVVNVDKETGNVTVTPEKAVYWKNKQPASITAWYPVDEKIDFTHQDQRLAYLLKGESSADADYNTSATLAFTHQLCKVRVKLAGDKASDVQAVTVRSYPTTTNTQGTSGNNEGTPDYYPMLKATYGNETYWEANLLPGSLKADDTFRMSSDGKQFEQVKLTGDVPIVPGKVHTITITVNQKPTEIDLSTYNGPSPLTVSGTTIIKGNGQTKDLQINIEDGSDVTLQNVDLSHTGSAPIVCKGDVSLTLAGSNTLAATSVAWNSKTGTGIYVESGTLTINAESGASLAISRTGGGVNQVYGAGIGVTENAELIINGGTITVDGIASPGYECGAGIGGFDSETSGNITIAGGTITIGQPSWWSAGIGGGSNGNCKNITITGSSTVITVAKGKHNDHYIGCSTNGSVKGTITIGGGATVNCTKYETTHTGTL